MSEFDLQRFENEGGAVIKESSSVRALTGMGGSYNPVAFNLHTSNPGVSVDDDAAVVTITRDDYDDLVATEAILNAVRRVIAIAPKTQTIGIIAAIVDQAD